MDRFSFDSTPEPVNKNMNGRFIPKPGGGEKLKTGTFQLFAGPRL